MLRCVSRWELLQQVHSGGPTDALLFAQPGEAPGSAKRKPLSFFSLRSAPFPHKAEPGGTPLSCLSPQLTSPALQALNIAYQTGLAQVYFACSLKLEK